MNKVLAEKRGFILVLGCLAGVAAVTNDLTLPSLPDMVREFSIRMSTGQQMVGWFLFGIGIGQIPAGLLSDRVGRLPVLYFGAILFTLAGIACAVTDNIDVMLWSRFVQGLGGATGVVLSRAIIRDISSGAEAAKLMSILVMIFTIGPLLSPIIGAMLVYQWGWRAPFFAVVLFGALMLLGIGVALQETRVPTGREHPLRQLLLGVSEFFSHRRSMFGLSLVILPAAGFLAMITGSSTIIIELYGFPVQWFGLLYAGSGVAILVASTLSRALVLVHGVMRMLGIGVSLIGIASLQLLIIGWLGQASFWWLWGNVYLFMFGVGFMLPNATALALDPVPHIAGVASSIIGTTQGVAGAAGSLLSSAIYDGTVRNVAVIMGFFGAATTFAYLARPLVLRSEEIVRPDH